MSNRLYRNEGKHNLSHTISAVKDASEEFGIKKILVFTAHGDGALLLRSNVEPEVEVIAVTFPWEMSARIDGEVQYIGLSTAEQRAKLTAAGIKLVQGVMPFGSLGSENADIFRGIIASFDTFGGSTKLCVQSILMACDSGCVDAAERCIAMTSDTAIVARAGHAFSFLRSSSTFAIEQFICKPQFYQITRGALETRIAERFTGITIDAEPTKENAVALPSGQQSKPEGAEPA